jgi:hypothetical protein
LKAKPLVYSTTDLTCYPDNLDHVMAHDRASSLCTITLYIRILRGLGRSRYWTCMLTTMCLYLLTHSDHRFLQQLLRRLQTSISSHSLRASCIYDSHLPSRSLFNGTRGCAHCNAVAGTSEIEPSWHPRHDGCLVTRLQKSHRHRVLSLQYRYGLDISHRRGAAAMIMEIA